MIITLLFLFICIIHICMQRTSSPSAAMFSLNKSVFFFFFFLMNGNFYFILILEIILVLGFVNENLKIIVFVYFLNDRTYQFYYRYTICSNISVGQLTSRIKAASLLESGIYWNQFLHDKAFIIDGFLSVIIY